MAFEKRAWYFPLFRFLLNASVVNGWLIYRKIHKIKELDFLREIVNALLKPSEKSYKFVSLKTPDSVQYDRKNHNIMMGKHSIGTESVRKMSNQSVQNVMWLYMFSTG